MGERLLILTGSRHDDAVLVEVAEHLGLEPTCCAGPHDACAAIGRDAVALVVTEEECGAQAQAALAGRLALQPAWSDLPVIALTRRSVSGSATERQSMFDRLGHITLLQRPLRWETLLTAVAAAARSRRRQYVLAEHMARLAASAAELELQVRERTRSLQEAMGQLQRTQRHLVESQRLEAVGQLTGGIAHDFNNLLQVILSNLTLATRAERRPELQRKALETIRQATARGAKLTQQLLAFASRQPLLEMTVDLRELMASFGEFLQRAVRQEIRLTVDVAPDTWPVTTDVAQLEMAVMNLVVNAQDAIDGPGRIEVGISNDSLPPALAPPAVRDAHGRDAAFVRIDVRDSGCGMSDDVARQAFEPFFTTKALDKGTGLGLSQVYGFARQSRGVAAVRQTGPAGTTMSLWLPKADADAEARAAAADAAPPSPADAPEAAPRPAHALRLLIVEDDPEVADAVDTMARHFGFVTTLARSAAEALDAHPERFDLVFSDVLMPGEMDGVALAQRLREQHPGLPVLLTSGYAGSPERVRNAGFTLLGKPYDEQQWLAAAMRSIGPRQGERMGRHGAGARNDSEGSSSGPPGNL